MEVCHRKQGKNKSKGLLKVKHHVVVSTDAIGMGLNLPIKRIVFLENEKFDGIRKSRLTSQEVKQIAGRAGRKGIYNVGKVALFTIINKMEELLFKDRCSFKNLYNCANECDVGTISKV